MITAYINAILGMWFLLFVHCFLLFTILFTLYKIAIKSLPIIWVLVFILIYILLPHTWEMVLVAQRVFTAVIFLISGIILSAYYFIYFKDIAKQKWVLYLSFLLMIISCLFRIDYIPFMVIPFLLLWLSKKITFKRTFKITIIGGLILVIFFTLSTYKNFYGGKKYSMIPITHITAAYLKYDYNSFTTTELDVINRVASVEVLRNNYSPLSAGKILFVPNGLGQTYNNSKEDYKALKSILLKHIINNPQVFLNKGIIYTSNMLLYPATFYYYFWYYHNATTKGPYQIVASNFIPFTADYYNKSQLLNLYLNDIFRLKIYKHIAVGFFYLIMLLPIVFIKFILSI